MYGMINISHFRSAVYIANENLIHKACDPCCKDIRYCTTCTVCQPSIAEFHCRSTVTAFFNDVLGV